MTSLGGIPKSVGDGSVLNYAARIRWAINKMTAGLTATALAHATHAAPAAQDACKLTVIGPFVLLGASPMPSY